MTDDKPTKRCTKCKRKHPATLEYFHKYLNGLTSICKECRNKYKQED